MRPDCYRCPRTGKSLIRTDDVLATEDGSYSYPVTRGIPSFLRYSSADDIHGEDELRTLNEVAGRSGWREAVAEVYGADSGMMRYVDTSDRSSFLGLLDLDETMNALEIGVGFGQITTALAARVASVQALEVRFQQALFTRQRLAEEGLDNLQIACGGDDCRLPYPDGSFDVVILSLVFEWCASRNDEAPGRAGQILFLKEVLRVLAPGGTVYLSTKNRYALRLLIGKRDEHAYGMRFGHALPRPLMNAVLKAQGHDAPVGTLHSYRALQRMLKDVGYVDSESFWAAPEARYPTSYIPTESESIREARKRPDFKQGEFRSTNLIMQSLPPFAVKYVTPGLVFTAKKPST
jgi:SAM-dependent methyltransferase